MTDEDIDRLATKLAERLQVAVTDNIYKDAGKNLISVLKKTLWAVLVAVAAWGAARYGTEGHGG